MKMNVETPWMDSRKHGKAFIRRMPAEQFIEPIHTERSKANVKSWFSFEAAPGELLQMRIDEGSWKNDRKTYAVVSESGELQEITQEEAARRIVAAKLANATEQQ